MQLWAGKGASVSSSFSYIPLDQSWSDLSLQSLHFSLFYFFGIEYMIKIKLNEHLERAALVVVSTFSLQQGQGLFRVEFLLPVSAWVLSGYSGFLPRSKNMQTGG